MRPWGMDNPIKMIERRLRHSLSPGSSRKQLEAALRLLRRIDSATANQSLLLGSLRADQARALPDGSPLTLAEFRVFSQWGEDGILQYLISRVPSIPKTFVEFGVEDYQESNTRFLLEHDDWQGLAMDGSPENIELIRAAPFFWRHDLQAVQAFITAENINGLIRAGGFSGDLGILSIDVDGNDYWIWKAVEAVSPVIVVCEYNALFGSQEAITVPYDPAFQRTQAHHSNLFFGASLRALCTLAVEKGYRFVGCNRDGVNAFFVRQDQAERLPRPSPAEGFSSSRFRESRDPKGRSTFLRGADRLEAIEHLQVWRVDHQDLRRLADLDLFPAS